MKQRQRELCELFVHRLQAAGEFGGVVQLMRAARGTEGEDLQETVDELVKQFKILLDKLAAGMTNRG